MQDAVSTYACSVHHRTQGGAGVGRPTPPAGRAAPAAGFSPPVRVAPPEREARSLSATREARAKRGRIFYTRTHLKNLPPPSQAPRAPRTPPDTPIATPRPMKHAPRGPPRARTPCGGLTGPPSPPRAQQGRKLLPFRGSLRGGWREGSERVGRWGRVIPHLEANDLI